jgi:hypothetical protein
LKRILVGGRNGKLKFQSLPDCCAKHQQVKEKEADDPMNAHGKLNNEKVRQAGGLSDLGLIIQLI